MISFPARGRKTLDQIFTNLKIFYKTGESSPSFGLSDHVSITMSPAKRVKLRHHDTTVKARDKRLSNTASLRSFFSKNTLENILSSHQSSDDKFTFVTDIIIYSLKTIMSEKSIKVNVMIVRG